MGYPVNGPVFNLRTRRIVPKEVVAVPVFGWPDWSWNEAAPTVVAHIFQHSVYTRSAKRTLVGTNARFERIRRQHLVAILTGRPKFEHTDSFAVTANDDWGPKKGLSLRNITWVHRIILQNRKHYQERPFHGVSLGTQRPTAERYSRHSLPNWDSSHGSS